MEVKSHDADLADHNREHNRNPGCPAVSDASHRKSSGRQPHSSRHKNWRSKSTPLVRDDLPGSANSGRTANVASAEPNGTPITPSAPGGSIGTACSKKEATTGVHSRDPPFRGNNLQALSSAPPSNRSRAHATSWLTKCFDEHWTPFEVERGVNNGYVHVAPLRVNPGDCTQAFVTLPGLSSDLLIKGRAQNRAIDLDVVALVILPPDQWHRIRGNGPPPQHGRPVACDATPSPIGSNCPPSAPGVVAVGCERPPWPADCGIDCRGQPLPASNDASDFHPDTADNARATSGPLAQCYGGQRSRSLQPLHERLSEALSLGSSDARPGTSRDQHGQSKTKKTKASLAQSLPATIPTAATVAITPAAAAIAKLNQQLQADPCVRVTALVVRIMQPSRRRASLVGTLGVAFPGAPLTLTPSDKRLPCCTVQGEHLPAEHREALIEEARRTPGQVQVPDAAAPTLVSASMLPWSADALLPSAEVDGILGSIGNLKCELDALLAAESAPTSSDFDGKVLQDLPPPGWTISDTDLEGRRDLRGDRVFTIDPPSARDLDDALSVALLTGGGLRVGVHIADVSYFVRPGGYLDSEALLRGTSVYMPDRVVPMLPRRLCEELCSLVAGTPRLTFSIIWELSPAGEVVSQWAGRSVICSCAQLAYDDAQAVIDAVSGNGSSADGLGKRSVPEVLGGFTWEQVARDIMLLHREAGRRRNARKEAGALRLDNTKLDFQLAPDGSPLSCRTHVQREANQLVEEFMLLANIQAAVIVSGAFPSQALLRCHPEPNPRMMAAAASTAADVGLLFDCSSAGAVADSLRTALSDASLDPHVANILQLLFTKPMQLAQYFCAGERGREFWRHYALAVDAYTHFTSPIRRYPDIIVHRQLATALERASPLQQPRKEAGPESWQPEQWSAAEQAPQQWSQKSDSSLDKSQQQRQQQQTRGQQQLQNVTCQLALLQNSGAATPPRKQEEQEQHQQAGGHQWDSKPVGTNSAARRRKKRQEEHQQREREWEVSPGPLSSGVPPSMASQHGVPTLEQVTAIAQHCNETKLAAKAVQDASCKVYLGALLRARGGRATTAVITAAGGKQWFSVYLGEFGHEGRIVTADLPCRSSWDPQTKTLTLLPNKSGRATSVADSNSDGGNNGPGRVDASYSNEAGIRPLALPAVLRTLSPVPVVLRHNKDPSARLGALVVELLL